MYGRLLLLNGPNLNMTREREFYGDFSLTELETTLTSFVTERQFALDCFQSNHEGELVERIQAAASGYDGIIFNPAAYSHTSVALRDAIAAIETPVIEVHLSNIYNREPFRRETLTAAACKGQITGLGMTGYFLAARTFMYNDQKG